jgi:GAF domain-containing protein
MIALSGTAQRSRGSDAAHRTVQRLAREALPALADFCLVYQLAGRTLRAIAAVHVTRQGSRDVRALMKAYRIKMADRVSTVAQVVRTQRPILRTEIRADAGKGKPGSVTSLHLRLATRSALVVPIVRDGTVLGAVSLCYSRSGRTYDGRHIASAERFARRVAGALLPADGRNAPSVLERPAREGRTVQQRTATQR